MFLDPCTQEYEREVERILHLNQLADRLPDSFNNATNVTKSHIHVVSVFARLERPVIQTTPMKKGRGRDLQPCKRRTQGEVRTTCRGVLPYIELGLSRVIGSSIFALRYLDSLRTSYNVGR
jgi:hypothetical protein